MSLRNWNARFLVQACTNISVQNIYLCGVFLTAMQSKKMKDDSEFLPRDNLITAKKFKSHGALQFQQGNQANSCSKSQWDKIMTQKID